MKRQTCSKTWAPSSEIQPFSSQMGMNWPQMSDLKGWKCAASEAYGISSIPASVLLDPQGKIIATNLRGKALGEKLKEIYGE